jgi:hypothetical protein
MALVHLDIQSLTEFRRVNKRAKSMTDSNTQYKLIKTHAPESIRGCLGLKTARFITCQDLYEKLSTAECDSCGDFGGYLYLITCRRVCFLCFTEKADFLPLPRNEVLRRFGLSSEHLATLPFLKSVPGIYSPRGIKCQRRERLFDYSAAQKQGIAIHGSAESMEEHVSETARKKLESYSAKASVCRRGIRLRQPRTEDPFDGHSSSPRSFMAIIRAPFLRSAREPPEFGSHCLACKPHHYHRPLHWRRKYTLATFQDHIEECGQIVDGKHVTPASEKISCK